MVRLWAQQAVGSFAASAGVSLGRARVAGATGSEPSGLVAWLV